MHSEHTVVESLKVTYVGHTCNRVRTLMENLEKSWNFKMVISRPGKVLKKTLIIKVLEKSWKCVIMICSFTPSLK